MKNKVLCLGAALLLLTVSCKESKTTTTNSNGKEVAAVYEGKDLSDEYDAKIDEIVSKMTLEEKVGMLHGYSMFTNQGTERRATGCSGRN
jgi:beta-glucosidase